VENLNKRTIRNKAPLLIGKRIGSSPLNGSVDDVRVYRRALPPDQVALLAVGPDLKELIAIDPAKRTAEQTAKLSAALLAPLPEYVAAIGERDTANQSLISIEADPR